jgi:hypothetical protein
MSPAAAFSMCVRAISRSFFNRKCPIEQMFRQGEFSIDSEGRECLRQKGASLPILAEKDCISPYKAIWRSHVGR